MRDAKRRSDPDSWPRSSSRRPGRRAPFDFIRATIDTLEMTCKLQRAASAFDAVAAPRRKRRTCNFN